MSVTASHHPFVPETLLGGLGSAEFPSTEAGGSAMLLMTRRRVVDGNIREATRLAEGEIKLFTGAAQERIDEEVKTAQAKIQALRDKANEITVQGAKDQFETASKALRRKVIAWSILAAG